MGTDTTVKLEAIINGATRTFEARPEDAAVEVIRDQLALTGTKLVCGGGVCGACTILVDGVPKTSCLLPATALAGRRVETVEGHATAGMHPVQRAFMAHDGLQCGFCTPGFINEAVAFYRTWRDAHGTRRPSRDEVAAAMAGHLCRCGAYYGIYEAIQAACEGRFDDDAPVVSPRVEAAHKVTGRAVYTVDVKLPGQLVGAIVRSPHANARVLKIDFARALALPGVKAAVELVDARRRVRYVGHPVAAVAATSRHVAEEALRAVVVEYEVSPAAIDPHEARREGAPEVYPERDKKAPTAAEMPNMPAKWTGNVRRSRVDLASRHGDRARKALDEARKSAPERVVSATWTTPGQSHTAFEPHACVARWESAEKLTVYVSTQSCWSMAKDLAAHFKLKRENVEVRCEFVGGAFGAKQLPTTEVFAAVELSRKASAPVAVVYDRFEEMVDGGYRPAQEVELALVAGADGALQAMCANIEGYAGNAIDSLVSVVLSQLYVCPSRAFQERDVVTHVAPGKPFRAPAGPPALWALEQAVDMMAEKLGVDAIALRQRWDDHAGRARLYALAAEHPLWKTRRPAGADRGRLRRGVGVAMGNWLSLYSKHTHVEVSASPAGFAARTAGQDMGNGARSVIASALAEVFGVSPLEVTVHIGVSSAPRSVSSAASATTNAVLHPTQAAAREVRDALVAAAKKKGLRDPRAVPGGIEHAGGRVAWKDFLATVEPLKAVAKRGTDGALDVMGLVPVGSSGATIGKGTTGAVYLAEVEVDARLGRTRVLHVWGGLNAGKIVVEPLARSQVYGGIIQGVGYALYEERRLDARTGHVLSYNLEDYRIPGIADVPEVTLHFDEAGFEHVKGGAAGLSELSTIPLAAVIGNAVYNATGWRPTALPITPERLLAGLKTTEARS
jgi:xanthine dehydrogenase YagR molybdenum-binding subunit